MNDENMLETIYSLQNYFNTFYDYCPITTAKESEFNDICRTLRIEIETYPLSFYANLPREADYVLVDARYLDDNCECVERYIWAPVPGQLPLKKFDSIKEAKEYAQNFGKYDFEEVKIKGKSVLLIGTELLMEDMARSKFEDIYDSIFYDLSIDADEEIKYELSSEMETLLEEALKKNGIEVVRVFDEF